MTDFLSLARSRLDQLKLLQPGAVSVELMSARLRRQLEDGTSRSITGGIILNDRMGVCRNDWGHKHGQTSFIVFQHTKGQWSKDHLGNYEVEWRGPKREDKTQAAIDESILAALDEALRDAIRELL